MDEKERKAFEGDAQAQCDMGDDYFFEAFDADIEDKDVLYRKAIYWYHRAAQKGHAASQYNLAYQYEHGLGIEIDLEQAVYWYRRAANQGYGAAENNLGHLYETGCGLPQDYAQALHWYGHGVRQDLYQAVYWFAQSAASGYKEGMKNYARALEKGEGVEKDTVEAACWRQKGNEQD